MITPMTSTDPLVEALATRLRRMDLVGWQRIATLAEQSELSFEDLRLLLAFALMLDVASPAIHRLRGRGYLREERRQYSLSQQGQELVARLDAAHREGIQAYVEQLNPDERRQLEAALGSAG
jgi:hypothetical protein